MAKKVLVLVNQVQGRPAPYLNRLREAGFEVKLSGLDRLPTEDELIKLLPGVFGTIAGGEPYTERVFAASPDLDHELTNAIVDALDAHTSMSTTALNSATVRSGLKKILLDNVRLWEALRDKADSQ